MRNVISCTVRKWLDDNASATGAALAFYCAFSLAPLLIIVLALAGWIVGEQAAFGFIRAQLHLLFGSATAALLVDAMKNSQRTEGIAAAIISIGTLLIGATSVFTALQQALQKILGDPMPARSGLRLWLRTRLLSFGFILALSFLLLVSLTVSTGIAGLRSWATNRYSSLLVTVGILDFVVSIALTTTLFAVIYRYMTTRRLPWKLVASGGLLTAVLFALGKWGIGLYLAKSTVPTAFGAAASFAALLLWLYYTAQIFLLGAEFTACLGATGKKGRPR